MVIKAMAVNPDPRTLLLPDPEAIPSFLSDKFAPILGFGTLFTTVVMHRYFNRRPLLSGIQVHVAAGLLGMGISKFLLDRHNQYNMEKDAVVRHYIELHPEDFPPPERKKVGDVFESWNPIR